MKSVEYHPLLHRVAVATLILALLPIIVGALVTTLDAGMAFRDWPSSDGHNLFFYPWLKSAGDKFIEHGHRLAGALIGFVSIGLALVAWKCESRRNVRWACYGVLAAVCVQGGLGGGRVRLDARTLAMVHGSFAALVFALMACVAVVTSRSWIEESPAETENATPSKRSEVSPALSVLAGVSCLAIFLQYLIGGFIRHLGLALHEHLGGAIFVTLLVTATAIAGHFSKVPSLRRAGWMMFGFLLLQVGLGLTTWVMKFGFTPTGYVAVVNSTPQIILRTAHTVSGMWLLASAVTLKLKTSRQNSTHTRSVSLRDNMTTTLPSESLSWEGGLQ